MNVVILSGNIGQDPERRYTPGGKGVSSFSIADTRRWTNASGEKVEETQWINIEAWGGLGDFVERSLRKGTRVLVHGRLKVDKYETEGETKYYTKVVAQEIEVQKWADGGPRPDPEEPF